MPSSAFSSSADSMLIESEFSTHASLMVLFVRGLDCLLIEFYDFIYARVMHVIYWLIPKA